MDNPVSPLSVKRGSFLAAVNQNSTYSPCKISFLVFVETRSAREDDGVVEGRGRSALTNIDGCESTCKLAVMVGFTKSRVVEG